MASRAATRDPWPRMHNCSPGLGSYHLIVSWLLTLGLPCSSAWSDPNSVPNLWGYFIRISPLGSEIFVFLLRIETLQLASLFLHAELSFLVRKGGFGQAYPVKRREIVIRGIEHKRVQLAAANANI